MSGDISLALWHQCLNTNALFYYSYRHTWNKNGKFMFSAQIYEILQIDVQHQMVRTYRCHVWPLCNSMEITSVFYIIYLTKWIEHLQIPLTAVVQIEYVCLHNVSRCISMVWRQRLQPDLTTCQHIDFNMTI